MQDYGFLGCDVSKGMSNFVLQDAQGQELESNFQLDDNKEGHQTLSKLLVELKNKHHLKKVIIGLESTGGYENNWYTYLDNQSQELGLEVLRINPRRIYHESKTEGRGSITDGISAQIIAGYLSKNYGRKELMAKKGEGSKDYASLRSLHKYIQRLIKQSTQTKNALEKLLYTSMPELLSIKGDKYPNWFLDLLMLHPTKEAILTAGIQGLSQIKHLTKTKARQICDAIDQSVGAASDHYMGLLIEEQAQDIQRLKFKIDDLKKKFICLAQKEENIPEQIDLICSIKGIAQDTALAIIIEIGDLDRFDKASNLVAFWGINPTFKQSGDKNVYIGMSKKGSPSARATIYMAARNVIIHEPYFKAIYHKQRKKGKSHGTAMGVVMAKLTRIIFGLLKNRSTFDAGTDTFNQIKKPLEEKNATVDKTQRRYQTQSTKAPISWKQRNSRKKQELDVSN